MNLRKIALLTALGSAIGVAGVVHQSETGHAAYYYWTKTKTYAPSKAYHQKSQRTTAYLWAAHRQYRVHNMKNYPGHTWFVSKSVKMRGAVYYRVTTQYGAKTVSGYVWRGYVAAGAFAGATGTTGVAGTTGKTYSYPSKGIYYSTLPYASTYNRQRVDGYDPTSFMSNSEYAAISSSIVDSFSPAVSTGQSQQVVS